MASITRDAAPSPHLDDLDTLELGIQIVGHRREHGAVEPFLGLEDAVDDESRDGGGLGDLLQRCAVEPGGEERAGGDLDDLITPFRPREAGGWAVGRRH